MSVQKKLAVKIRKRAGTDRRKSARKKEQKELPVRKRGEKKKAEEVNCRERIGNLHRIRERERGLPIQKQKSSTGKVRSTDLKRKQERNISAQNSIPYREMAKDGICRVQGKYYSKTIRFYDINYQLAQNEDKNC